MTLLRRMQYKEQAEIIKRLQLNLLQVNIHTWKGTITNFSSCKINWREIGLHLTLLRQQEHIYQIQAATWIPTEMRSQDLFFH